GGCIFAPPRALSVRGPGGLLLPRPRRVLLLRPGGLLLLVRRLLRPAGGRRLAVPLLLLRADDGRAGAGGLRLDELLLRAPGAVPAPRLRRHQLLHAGDGGAGHAGQLLHAGVLPLLTAGRRGKQRGAGGGRPALPPAAPRGRDASRAARLALALFPQDDADALLGQACLPFFAATLPFEPLPRRQNPRGFWLAIDHGEFSFRLRRSEHVRHL